HDYIVTEVEGGISRKVTLRRVARIANTPWRTGEVPSLGARHAIAGKPHVLMLDLPAMPGSAAPEDNFRMAAFANPWRAQIAYSAPEDTGYAYSTAIEGPATVGALVDPLGAGPEGRFDHGSTLTVELYGGELASVSQAQLLGGVNTAAIRSDSGVW